MDPIVERSLLGIAHALFINRLHVLRLTEVVRLGVKPDREDGTMNLPAALDREMQQQAIDFVLTVFPGEMAPAINAAKKDWLRPA
ncbi:MAG TPA: hypothetical protein VKZ63_03600 [Kofleriaceae bacterium]|nr:hypothetical protein [Kofleriaceae bacterium]